MLSSQRSPLSVTTLCQQLIQFPSLSGHEGELAAFVARTLGKLDFEVETDRCGNVLGRRRGAQPGPTVLLDAHMDVVPVTHREAWTHDPFGGECGEGRVWGRGATDTKGSLAAMICATASLPGNQFRGTVLVSASVCEEDMTGVALAQILDRHPVDFTFVGEPTSLRLGIAQKGRAGLLVEAIGRTAHSSRPELGDNAVYKMIGAVNRLRAMPPPMDPDLGRGVCELIEMTSEPLPSPGMVPHTCRARFALRLMPGETPDSILTRCAAELQGMEGIHLRLDERSQRCYTGTEITMQEYVPAWKNNDTLLQERLLASLKAELQVGEPFIAPYTTNASTSAQRGIPTFLLGPGSIAQAHVIDEWIAVEELEAAERAYGAILRTLLI